MKLFGKNFLLLFLLWSLISSGQEKVVIFSINDMHSRIENFSKIKPLIDKEKGKGNRVLTTQGAMGKAMPSGSTTRQSR